jgi:hypothetical protein
MYARGRDLLAITVGAVSVEMMQWPQHANLDPNMGEHEFPMGNTP